jgi:cyanophycinase-like exopeptidase
MRMGLGLDEPACVVLENGQFARVLGKVVYQIEMTDLETRNYNLRAL